MKKLILSAFFALVSCYSFAQDDVYGSNNKGKNEDIKKFMQIEHDKFDELIRVSHKPFLGNNDFRVNCNFIIKNDKPQDLTLKVVHFGKDWLYVNKLVFLIAGKKYSLEVEPVRVVEGGYAVEKCYFKAFGTAKEIINALMVSDKLELRFVGKNYIDDAKQLSMDIKRLRRVVDYFKLLGGEF